MSDEIEYGAILTQWGKGKEVDTEDLINALAWRMNNQRREIARLSAAQARIAELEALVERGVTIIGISQSGFQTHKGEAWLMQARAALAPAKSKGETNT